MKEEFNGHVWEYDDSLRNVEGVPHGYRDVMWCPYANEPAFLIWKDDEPACSECSNFEFMTHEFIAHVKKP